MKTNSIFIFMAGDNNLETNGDNDIQEMCQSELAPELNVIIQFDRGKARIFEAPESKTTKRLKVENHNLVELEVIPETNTGDPKVLNEFLNWGISNFPAPRNIVILWNHGGGIKDMDISKPFFSNIMSSLFHRKEQSQTILTQMNQNEAITSSLARLNEQDYLPHREICPEQHYAISDQRIQESAMGAHLQNLNNLSQLSQINKKICDDMTSYDFLDTLEIKSALTTPKQKFDIVAFDACLMNMFEIIYQIKDLTKTVIGSEAIEPLTGWAYRPLLNYLSSNQTADNEVLAQNIVTFFKESYPETQDFITQSAIRTESLEKVAEVLNAFAGTLLGSSKTMKPKLAAILYSVQKFGEFGVYGDKDYIDLCHFVNLCKETIPQQDISDSAAHLLNLLKEEKIIIANINNGKSVGNAYGISIYFPLKKPPEKVLAIYRKLDFTQKCPNWLKLMTSYHTLR